MSLEEKLIMLRRQQGLTQDELAKEVGVTRQAVSKWERGVMAPSTVNLIALGRLYGIPLDELVNGGPQDGEPPDENAAEEPPEAVEPAKAGQLKTAGGIVLAACLLLTAAASVLTISSAIFKEPEKPKDGLTIVNQDDLEQEIVDLNDLIPFEGKSGIFTP